MLKSKHRLFKILKRYLISFAIVQLILFFILFSKGEHSSLSQLFEFYFESNRILFKNYYFWIAIMIILLPVYYIESIIKDFKHSIKRGFISGLLIKLISPILLFIFLHFLVDTYRYSESFDSNWLQVVENESGKIRDLYAEDKKQRGIHFFGSPKTYKDFAYLVENNFEWITVSPFIHQEEYNTPSLDTLTSAKISNLENRFQILSKYSKLTGLKIMLKPHIWLRVNDESKLRSDIEMENENDWKLWFENYQQSILKLASMAEKYGFQQFCIGTELRNTAVKKPEYWIDLIRKIRELYSGKIVYAANWDNEYELIAFWDQLDFIGIQAYFPLSEDVNPKLEELEESWRNYTLKLESISLTHDKPILFTELGYKSVEGSSINPWRWSSSRDLLKKISHKEQFLCYQSFFNTLWNEDWFHGLHIWEWQGNNSSFFQEVDFTIEGKPAFHLISQQFGMKANSKN